MPDKKKTEMNFAFLIQAIRTTHEHFSAQSIRAVNVGLTLRNWFIGAHIAEFELRGADRAHYGDRLLDELSLELRKADISNTGRRQLYQYLAFFRTYPQIARTVPAQSRMLLPEVTGHLNKVRTASAQSSIPPETLMNQLSYSHFELLMGLDDDLKRRFYEMECIRGQWSVRELKRQIATLYFERSGLSKDKEKLAAIVQGGVETQSPSLSIRDPYVFEFLGIKPREVMGESHLEDALLDKVQEFLLELGRGFCFEARQKRILIGDEFYFVDLVFYHRILKCHVLIDLKVDEFKHEHVGQLNTYVTWFQKNEMTTGDNPPIGLLLCTRKNHALIEYALAGMDNQLFVSRYQLELPKKKELERFLEAKLKEQGSVQPEEIS